MDDTKRMKDLKKKEEILRSAASSIRVQEKDLPRVVERFKNEIKEMEERISNYSNE